MATILERFNALGLAHSNPILQLVGSHVSRQIQYQYKKFQVEDGQTYFVNNYSDADVSDIDLIIQLWVTRKRTKAERAEIRQWWAYYKQLPK